MTVFKCKMCGGSIDVVNNESVAECEYCGTKQTLPTAQDENLQALFNRANQLRMKSEFDRAETLYEKIIQNKPNEPEAHWGLILCKFGIEYVEDPKTFKRIPTCHRTSFDSITADDDYKEALKYSDSIQRALYENEAKEIDRIQKEILALSSKEEPYDVFICYKETDEKGQRTPDSAIANDIYHQLTNENFKVFYAAISLEDKLGSAYEPCIFAALNSSKVMLAIGTNPEYFNAVWVKNEWSRFLKMMKNDKSKLLIPCYKGMDAYDLPDDFAHLQAQDMNKIGFINDIVRGIKKVIVKDKPKPENTQTVVVNANVQSLLRRVFIFLEDGDFTSADEYCEKVLDIEPENAHAYLGKLMAELQVKQQDDLKNLSKTFDDNSNYRKILKFGDEQLKSEIKNYTNSINERHHLVELEKKYKQAYSLYSDLKADKNQINQARHIFESISEYKDSQDFITKCDERYHLFKLAEFEKKYQQAYSLYSDLKADKNQINQAKHIFESISDYKDSQSFITKCDNQINEIKLEEKYQKANNLVPSLFKNLDTQQEILSAISGIDEAEKIFISLGDYKSSESMVETCRNRKQEYQAKIKEIEKAKKHRKKIAVFGSITAVSIVLAIILVNTIIIPSVKYNNATTMLKNGQYDEAITAFSELGYYKDSINKIIETKNAKTEFEMNQKYNNANKLFEEKKYDEAITAFRELGDYKDSKTKLTEVQNTKTEFEKITKYENANKLADEGKYNEAITAFTELGDYKNSEIKVIETKNAKYENANKLVDKGKYNEAITAFTELGDYKDSKTKLTEVQNTKTEFEKITKYENANKLVDEGKYEEALTIFDKLEDYKDSKEKHNNLFLILQETNMNRQKTFFISAGSFYTIGLKKDGTVMATGLNIDGQCNVSGWTDIIAVSAGYNHTVGLKADGTIVTTGSNVDGQCNVSDWKDIIAISAGENHTVGLKKDGTVVATGSNVDGQCNVSDWKDIIAISAGNSYTVGLKANGTVVSVGNFENRKRDVSDWKDIVAISAGREHTVGLKKDGTVVVTGKNDNNQYNVSRWKDIVSILAGTHYTVGLTKDGTIVSTLNSHQDSVSKWKDIIAISSRNEHIVGVKKDGTVVATGGNIYGQCNVSDWKLKVD